MDPYEHTNYKPLPLSAQTVAGPSHDGPKVTSGPSNSPEEKEADIVKPVESNLVGTGLQDPIQDIAYIDKKEDGHLNIHHGDRKQTNTTFENEKIGEYFMRKIAEEVLQNYSRVKTAGVVSETAGSFIMPGMLPGGLAGLAVGGYPSYEELMASEPKWASNWIPFVGPYRLGRRMRTDVPALTREHREKEKKKKDD